MVLLNGLDIAETSTSFEIEFRQFCEPAERIDIAEAVTMGKIQ